MARPILYVPPQGGLFLVTTRTIQQRFLLRPSRRFNSLALGIIGRAQRRHGVKIHCGAFLSNHYHLLISVENAQQLAAFMNLLNGKLAKEVGRLHGWKDRIWSRRYRPTLVSEEPVAQIERLRYLLAHGCKEDLVSSPLDWPGIPFAKALLSGEPLRGAWIDRTQQYNARRRAEVASDEEFSEPEFVELTPLPCWQHLTSEDYRARIQGLIDDVANETAKRQRRTGRKPLGVSRVLTQSPLQRPNQTTKSPAPRFHCVSKDARRRLTAAYREFLEAYRRAAERLKAGDRGAIFPAGCFPPRLPFIFHQLAPD